MSVKNVMEKLPPRFRSVLENMGECELNDICEIRLRKDAPLCVIMPQKTLYADVGGGFTEYPYDGLPTLKSDEVLYTFSELSNHSYYAHENEIKEGYLTFSGGCRIGLGGDFTSGDSGDITSLNIRIARAFPGCADALLPLAKDGLLIAGPPAVGKTTVLRETARKISNRNIRVCVVDSRHEITAGFDMGFNTDAVLIADKAKGVETALRTLNPQIIVFDEIGNSAELTAVNECLNAGVSVITTAHSGSINELKSRPVTSKLLAGGAIKNVALLKKIGAKPQIFSVGEIYADIT